MCERATTLTGKKNRGNVPARRHRFRYAPQAPLVRRIGGPMTRSPAERPRIVVIAGPTASGKTSVGVELALELDAEIVNADSMQVYRGMDVGTAKPTARERKGVPHHLLDVVDPDHGFDAARYRELASTVIRDIVSRGKACVVVGGTGLYIKALTEGLFRCPPSDPALREELAAQCRLLGSAALHERLHGMDPATAERIHPHDGMRIVRALEIIRLTDRLPSELGREHGFGDRSFATLRLALRMERERLYERINTRAIAMMEGGLEEETRELLHKGYAPGLKPMKSIGYRHMVRYLAGDRTREDTLASLQRDTRRYAKRQLTWFNADTHMEWMEPGDLSRILRVTRRFLAAG